MGKIIRIKPSYGQVNLDDGSKVLVSGTIEELAVFKLNFLTFPTKKIWHSNQSMTDLCLRMKIHPENIIGVFCTEISECTKLEEVKEKIEEIINFYLN